jgi:hypothetical protein
LRSQVPPGNGYEEGHRQPNAHTTHTASHVAGTIVLFRPQLHAAPSAAATSACTCSRASRTVLEVLSASAAASSARRWQRLASASSRGDSRIARFTRRSPLRRPAIAPGRRDVSSTTARTVCTATHSGYTWCLCLRCCVATRANPWRNTRGGYTRSQCSRFARPSMQTHAWLVHVQQYRCGMHGRCMPHQMHERNTTGGSGLVISMHRCGQMWLSTLERTSSQDRIVWGGEGRQSGEN